MTKRYSHKIDLIFPIVLFFIFTLFSVMVLLLAARSYRATVEGTLRSDDARASLAYMSEKLHQNDSENSVYLGTFDSRDAIIIEHDSNYVSYLYFDDGALKELFTTKNAPVSAESGQIIFKLKELTIERMSDALFQLYASDEGGHSASIVIGLRCEGGDLT